MPEPSESLHVPVAPGVSLRVIDRLPALEGPELPSFLLVHGLASNARMWDGCAEALRALGHRSVAVDLRGHGHSDKPDTGYDFATVAADLVALIAQLGLRRPVAVGQSWGGNVVVDLAVEHPELVRGAVAVDGGTIELQDRFETWEEVAEALRPPNLLGVHRSQILARMRAAHPDWPHEGIEGTLANFEVLADGTVRPWLTLERHLLILRELWLHRPSELFGRLTAPTMLVPAANDANASWTHDKEASISAAEAAIVGAPRRTVWFSPADHDLHAQFPERLAAVLHDATEDGFFA